MCPAHQPDIPWTVVATPTVGIVVMMELQVFPSGTPSATVVDEAAAPAIPRVNAPPHGRRDVA